MRIHIAIRVIFILFCFILVELLKHIDIDIVHVLFFVFYHVLSRDLSLYGKCNYTLYTTSIYFVLCKAGSIRSRSIDVY